MKAKTAIKHLEQTAFWPKETWSGAYRVCLGKRVGINAELPKHIAEALCTKLNSAITEVRIMIQAEAQPQQKMSLES